MRPDVYQQYLGALGELREADMKASRFFPMLLTYYCSRPWRRPLVPMAVLVRAIGAVAAAVATIVVAVLMRGGLS